MKEPKGFASFLGEEKKKSVKKKAKPKAGKKRKADKGKDDDKFIALMDEYKRSRTRDKEMAERVHRKARELDINGDVSEKAHEVVRYL